MTSDAERQRWRGRGRKSEDVYGERQSKGGTWDWEGGTAREEEEEQIHIERTEQCQYYRVH